MTEPTKTKAMCVGCRNDFYNQTRPNGCWSFDSATIVPRIQVGTFENPPYKTNRVKPYLSCYHAEGCAMLKPDDCRVRDTQFSETSET